MLNMEAKDYVVGGIALVGTGFGIADFIIAKKALKKAKNNEKKIDAQTTHNEKVDQGMTYISAQVETIAKAVGAVPAATAATTQQPVQAAPSGGAPVQDTTEKK